MRDIPLQKTATCILRNESGSDFFVSSSRDIEEVNSVNEKILRPPENYFKRDGNIFHFRAVLSQWAEEKLYFHYV